MNEVYKRLLNSLYGIFPENLKEIISDYGPSGISKYVNVEVPFVGEMIKGAIYFPYTLAFYIGSHAVLRHKKEDLNEEYARKIAEIPYLYTSVIGPFLEEAIFRYMPSLIGKFVGGDVGELAALGVSTVAFSLLHSHKYKRGHLKGFIKDLLYSLFYPHVFLKHGFFGSFGLHSFTNLIGTYLVKRRYKRY